jgi:muramoyltetrapeptide carboxypeptidase
MSSIILPQRLLPGDQVALVAPAFQPTSLQVQQACKRLQALGLSVVDLMSHQQNDGYFNGSAHAITSTLHEAFLNPQIKALISVRGGYGCARLLPLLDWNLIQANPKIVLGFSDITALLIAIHQRTGLVTFHGPGASMPWPQFTLNSLREILFSGEMPRFQYLNKPTDDVIEITEDIKILRGGCATGRLIGGNLSVLTSLIGSEYLPNDWSDKILFLEDVHEEVYRLDRMLTQLKLANILSKIKGLIFGRFNDCTAKIPQSFSVMELLKRFANDLNIPVLANMTFGHQPEMHTLPIGATVSLNADEKFIELLNPAVS